MPPAGKASSSNASQGSSATGLELKRVRDRELELKRITGEISCAECRRLKLKCDKKVPCGSCTRRGCKHICPTGTNASPNVRQAIAAASSSKAQDGSDADIDSKLAAMSERIRALEDALAVESSETHPLLSPELLAIKQGIDSIDSYADRADGDDAENEMLSAFGTLSVSEGKTMRFLGASAAENVLLMEVLGSEPSARALADSTSNVSQKHKNNAFPFTPSYLSRAAHAAQVASHLPPYEEAVTLVNVFFSSLWMLVPIGRTGIEEDLFSQFYPGNSPVLPSAVTVEQMHDLALLYAVLSCGAVADQGNDATSIDADRLQQLARTSLGLRSVFDFGSLAACQTLFLLGCYEVYLGSKTSQESAWKLMGLGTSVAASIGLHRDPSRWNLDPKTVNNRRRVFWEINTTDKWRSLSTGRPAMFNAHVIDCEFPLDVGATVGEDGEVVESIWQWRYRFTRDVLPKLTENLCSARPIKYSEVMKLDRLVRDFDQHPHVSQSSKQFIGFATDGDFRVMNPLLVAWEKLTALQYVHRNFFARAILESAAEPLRSPFAPSFLATYRTATTKLKLLTKFHDVSSESLSKWAPMWSSALISGVIVGSVASRCPNVSFAPLAMRDLEAIISIFEKAPDHPVPRNGVTLLYRLRKRAFDAFAKKSGAADPSAGLSGKEVVTTEDRVASQGQKDMDDNPDEELEILRGSTRYIEQRPMEALPPKPPTYAQMFLTLENETAAASLPSTLHNSPMPSGHVSTNSSTQTSESPSTQDTSLQPRGGRASGSSMFGDMNMQEMMAPSSLVQQSPATASNAYPTPPETQTQAYAPHMNTAYAQQHQQYHDLGSGSQQFIHSGPSQQWAPEGLANTQYQISPGMSQYDAQSAGVQQHAYLPHEQPSVHYQQHHRVNQVNSMMYQQQQQQQHLPQQHIPQQQQYQQNSYQSQSYVGNAGYDQAQFFGNLQFDVSGILPEAEYAAIPDYMSFVPQPSAPPMQETVDNEMWQLFMQQSGFMNLPDPGAGPAGWSNAAGDFFG